MQDLEMLKNIDRWPRVDDETQICCVKNLRPGSLPTLDFFGRLIAKNGRIINEAGKTGVTIVRDRGFAPINYESIEAMVYDGWVVD